MNYWNRGIDEYRLYWSGVGISIIWFGRVELIVKPDKMKNVVSKRYENASSRDKNSWYKSLQCLGPMITQRRRIEFLFKVCKQN